MKQQKMKMISPKVGDVLAVIDVQNSFLPGGSLAVSDGDKIIPPLNRIIEIFGKKNRPIFFTRDWHPPDHCSFKENGGPWPAHAVQNTEGAGFSSALKVPKNVHIISKGADAGKEEYSGFYGSDASARQLHQLLSQLQIKRIFVGGLATDYCVLNTVKDMLKAGYKVTVLTDAIRAVDAKTGDGEKALAEMIKAGAKMMTSGEIG